MFTKRIGSSSLGKMGAELLAERKRQQGETVSYSCYNYCFGQVCVSGGGDEHATLFAPDLADYKKKCARAERE